MTRGVATAGLLTLGLGLAGPGTSGDAVATTLEELRERGYVRIAIANEPPYTEVKPDGKVSGAAPEVVRAVFKELGVPEILATVSEYGAMIPGLQAGRFDVVAAGLFMKPERCAAVAYSQPDVCGSEGMLVQKGNPLGIESHADVANNPDAVIGVCGGCIEEKYALDAGVPRSRMVIVPDINSGLKMVQSGRIDAYAMPTLSLADVVKKTNAKDVEIYAPTKNTPISCAGAAFRKSDKALRDAYDEVLVRLKESGRFEEILEPFGFSAKAATIASREELCAGN
ncbi:MAG: ectoine/hydroxyectoine ABC transporter substrate-binding protein EhuB [Gammaproteobacteria bacterium]|nr:ectoine/hydroxyectoine ABC transporter substrate-binding protein EhuB [Gammaproteobacteria bacterium]NIR85045.1 ectoine/hydroxyectoine ABC transporter substrate-binding protein EhuB [Gammaproteobacteria bacterium]NIR88312.1 ectoine/hydroxyectoine ABC transporter substrate-binding protein EhuB [Gammaproteobacteria bacterium]NIU06092.1 ectoine/hydroxyectoine ABC transporter substrate-binding protein EhuB [Gammaproteobacteria bacterium]NIV73511.1 ectoine/hydroxyectoine ABC transporter substrate